MSTRGHIFINYKNKNEQQSRLHLFGYHDFYQSAVIPIIKEAITLTKEDLKLVAVVNDSAVVAKLLFSNIIVSDKDGMVVVDEGEWVCDYVYFVDIEKESESFDYMVRCYDVCYTRGKKTGVPWYKLYELPDAYEILEEEFALKKAEKY